MYTAITFLLSMANTFTQKSKLYKRKQKKTKNKKQKKKQKKKKKRITNQKPEISSDIDILADECAYAYLIRV